MSASQSPGDQAPASDPRRQDVPAHVQGPTAVGGSVSQRGEYVAGHTLTIDQSVHMGSLLASWFSRPQPAPNPVELGRARRDLLDQVHRNWVEEFQRSLDRVARIELGFTERPDAVDSPVRAILRRPPEPDRPLDRGIGIDTVYRAFGRQLLILGEPGAGKTTLLMELARELVEEARAAPAEPMPVVFHLSSWTIEQRPLDVWLADELNRRYGVSRRLARSWLAGDQVVPLLDGLDEVVPADRDACVAAINVFHEAHGQLPLVICSRLQEYESLRARLQLRSAVVVQPLTRQDVDQHLRLAGRPMARVRSALRQDAQLFDLLTTPLVLSLVCLTYQGRPVAPGREHETVEDRRRRVFADYVEAMVQRPRPSARPETHPIEDTMRWLRWLARTMSARSQTVFYLDWIQPDWLGTRFQRWLATTGLATGVGLVSGLLFGVVSGLVFAPAGASIAGLPVGPLAGAVFGAGVALAHGLAAYGADVSPPERLFWSWTTLRRNLPRWLLAGALFGVVSGLIGGVIAGLATGSTGLVAALAGGLVGGIGLGSFFGLVGGLETRPQVAPTGPGTAIRTSARNALVSVLVTWLGGGVIAGVAGGVVIGLARPLSWLHVGVGLGLLAGFGAGLVVGLGGGLVLGLDAGLGAGRRGVLIVGLAAAMVGGIVGGLAAMAADPILGGLVVAGVVGLGAAMIVGLQRGGAVFLRHRAVTWLLARRGAAPGNYVGFLEDATRLILLRRTGGGYQFPHRLLLEYFAELPP